MITEEKIKIYSKYGDIDSWVRSGSKKEKMNMEDADWYEIDSFIQDLSLVNKGLASADFKIDLDNRLSENCDSETTISKLKSIVGFN